MTAIFLRGIAANDCRVGSFPGKDRLFNSGNAFFVDTRPFLENDDYFVDEMHPIYEGHEIIANVIFDSILKNELTE